ncbi:Xaa-Pro dipeptidyl-peptidase [Agromyces sp. CFH 90414]|uniref:Xaa-Pro dipeptidyl-peptidase n=1 Tax=Agromyces agglutinans TaxID=2662258 RepID=A0A6I2FG88_9MICO|nr:Xaa-Pro dipeptidyl-peptidase [Agromyces agglutinans]MRG61690.1 Xaa-Pro dipeptidyl-peptidase [Agromyces agglutinans]
MTPAIPRAVGRRRGRALAVAVTSVLACGLVVAASPAQATPEPEPAEPTFVDGLSQAVFTRVASEWINEEAWVESEVDSDRDGKPDLVHIDVSRVPETESTGLKVPVLMEMSPYYAGGTQVTNWPVDHEIGDPPSEKPGWPAFTPTNRTSPTISRSLESTWVPRGFAVVHAEGLGSGWSEGCPTSGAPNEVLAGKAVIDWLNGRAKAYTAPDRATEVAADWTTGQVGMTGTSYNGTLPIGVASTGVEGLEAIVPVSAISDWYGYYRSDGAVRAPGGYQGEDLDVLADYVYTRFDQEICQPILDELRANQDRATGDRSEFWEERNYLADADQISAATLVAHGLNDWNVMTGHASDLYEALKANDVPHQIYLHQGGHGGNPTDTLLNRWFTRYLYDVENGVEQLPKAYVVREDRTLTEYPEWPDPAAEDVKLKFRPAAAADGVGGLGISRDSNKAVEDLVDDASIRASVLAAAETSPNRLAYRTDALGAPLRLSGTPSVSLELSVDRAKANLTALLVEYPASGEPKIITRGWMDVENRNDAWLTEPIVPGQAYDFAFDFEPKDYVFNAGSRIGVVVMSSDQEYTVRPAPGTTLSVRPFKSELHLPLVGGTDALQASLRAAQ